MEATPAQEAGPAAGVRWNLSDLYAGTDDPQLEADLDRAKELAQAFESSYRGRVSELSAQELAKAIDDLEAIPKGLKGQHERNPVNLPVNAGVQMELPPTIRWNKAEMNWSDHDGTSRAPQVDQLIEALVVAVDAWTP